MPAKYSHIKKRSASGLLKKEKNSPNGHHIIKDTHLPRYSSPHVDRSITQAMSAVSQLERAISRILLLRYEQDIARLYSTRLFSVALVHLPTLVMRCCAIGGPSWLAFNYDCDEIKDFFRAAISMDMRQAGERVATKSVLWSYTALRHFAVSNDIPICNKLGLHSLRLLPFYPALQAHLDSLESMPLPIFTKPPHLGTLQEGLAALEDACELKFAWVNKFIGNKPEWDGDWRAPIRYGYEKLVQTMWRVSREFEVRGYGNILRDKLTSKWCDCGCSTDHLGEVCERTVREEEEHNGIRSGKQKEWDGRGSGVYGWETSEEEDIWEIEMDFGGGPDSEGYEYPERELTVDETMEWRYLQAEHEKEQGNVAFRKGDFDAAVQRYQAAYDIESELPHYQLNLAAAHLKLNNWMEAEKACTTALSQHRSSKGLYRRAKARRMLNRPEEAIQDLRAVLRMQPNNLEAVTELIDLIPNYASAQQNPLVPDHDHYNSSSYTAASSSSSSSSALPKAPGDQDHDTLLYQLGIPRPKQVKPPPFARTRADDKKLKIVFSPPISPSSTPAFPHLAQRAAAAKGGKGPPGLSNRPGKEKEKAGSARAKKLSEMEQLRKECASYPCWERYIVKQVD